MIQNKDLAKSEFKYHLLRLKAGASQATALDEVSRWIQENTYLRNKPFSFKDHEYQLRILNSTAREVVVRKPSQVGITEAVVRKALALIAMIRGFTVIYTLPTSTLSTIISKTRVNTVIEDSPYLKGLLAGTDTVEVKEFTNNSFLYMRGAASSNAPISIPADMLVHDELDFSDPHIISQYHSRLSHGPHKMKFKLSTPTIPGKGIDEEFQKSMRHYNFAKCTHCGHWFIPDYYQDVIIPGYSEHLSEVNAYNLYKLKYQEAYVACRRCKKPVNLLPQFREWVCENPDDNYDSDGIQVSPFDAPNIITPAQLITSSTVYPDVSEFINFNLGLPQSSKESVLSPEEIKGLIIPNYLEGGLFSVMGVDLGKTCHIVVARCDAEGAMQVVHLEKVPLGSLKQRYLESRLRFKVRVSVIDSLPYTDVVMALQAADINLWAAVYSVSKGVHLYKVHEETEDQEKAQQGIRQLNVARDRTFDSLMSYMRSGQFSKVTCEHDEEFIRHCTDMRRVKDAMAKTRAQAAEFRWLKSAQGDDHFWFAASYAYLAKFLIGAVSPYDIGALPLLSTIKIKDMEEGQEEKRLILRG